MRKLGAIDIGSNSIRLLVAEVEGGQIVESLKRLEMARIAEYKDSLNKLSEGAIKRCVLALEKLIALAVEERVEKLSIIATSAVREAENKMQLIEKVKTELGYDIEVVTGAGEAELGFLGVLGGIENQDENILVADVGGGSTEFIFGNASKIQYISSLDIGCVRLTDEFNIRDSIESVKMQMLINKIGQDFDKTVEELREFQIDRIIGIGGTITTLASVVQELETYDPKRIHNFDLMHEEIQKYLHLFATKSLAERKRIIGMYPKRADVITAGTAILDCLLMRLGKTSICVSEYDNLEGLIFRQIANKIC